MTQPAPGLVPVGALYIDAQSQEMWYGVSSGQDPSESVLVGNIVALQSNIDQALIDAKTYTDTQISTRSAVGHVHVASEITDLDEYLATFAPGLPRGLVMAWYGALNNVPAGWQICDGTNGTPDLREKYIIGGDNRVGGRPIHSEFGSWDPNMNATLIVAGSHSHGGATGNHALTQAQMPQHNHAVNDPGHGHGVNDPSHKHVEYHPNFSNIAYQVGGSVTAFATGEDTIFTGSSTTGIGVFGAGTGISLQSAGSSQVHNHTISAEGGHTHTFQAGGYIAPPTHCLIYIMKL